jgi:hypothetical protein
MNFPPSRNRFARNSSPWLFVAAFVALLTGALRLPAQTKPVIDRL